MLLAVLLGSASLILLCQSWMRLGGHTMSAGYWLVCSVTARACRLLPSPISSAMKHRCFSVAYATPARWYGYRSSCRAGMFMSASTALLRLIAVVSFSASMSAYSCTSFGIFISNLFAHSMMSPRLVVGAVHLFVSVFHLTPVMLLSWSTLNVS